MKLQIQSSSLRVRVDEAELAALLGGGELSLQLCSAGRTLVALVVGFGEALLLQAADGWRLTLPSDEVREYVATLPRREALAFEISQDNAPPLRIDFEVDVRDSLQVRGHRRRS